MRALTASLVQKAIEAAVEELGFTANMFTAMPEYVAIDGPQNLPGGHYHSKIVHKLIVAYGGNEGFQLFSPFLGSV